MSSLRSLPSLRSLIFPSLSSSASLRLCGEYVLRYSPATAGVSIHFSTPFGWGPRRSQSTRASAAFFISTSSAGLPRRNAAREPHKRLVAGEQNGALLVARAHLFHAPNGDASGSSAGVRTTLPWYRVPPPPRRRSPWRGDRGSKGSSPAPRRRPARASARAAASRVPRR